MKIDRLLGILTVLLQRERVTAPCLAARFEVSRRTISRDIDTLCAAGIPIITTQGGGGGIAIAPGYKLDATVLTADELAAMAAALKGIGTVSDTPHVQRMLDKLGAGRDAVLSLSEHVVIDLASHYKGSLSEKITLIKAAARDMRVIEFDYYYEKGEARRRLEPYCVVFQWTAWYVFGYDPMRGDWRMFKLARLWRLRETGDAFRPRPIPPEKHDFGAHLTDTHTLIALFEPSERYKLIETYGLDCYSEEPDGRLRLTAAYTHKDFIITWLLGFGGKAAAISPPEVVEGMREAARKMASLYEPT